MHNILFANKLGALLTELQDEIDADMAPFSDSSAAALLTLLHWGKTPVTELAAVLRLSQPATTRLVAKLVEQGLVERVEAPGRLAPVRLSTKGRSRARSLQARRIARLEQAMAPLKSSDREQLDRMLSSILAGLVKNRRHARQICRLCDHDICDGPLCPVGSAARAIEPAGGQDAAGT